MSFMGVVEKMTGWVNKMKDRLMDGGMLSDGKKVVEK